MNRQLNSRLDLIFPIIEDRMHSKQSKQKFYHDKTAKELLFKEGDNVFMRNFVQNSKTKWISGKVLAKTGPVSYKIELTNGTLVRRHIDHIRRCYMDKLDTEPTESEYDVDIEIPIRDDNEIKP